MTDQKMNVHQIIRARESIMHDISNHIQSVSQSTIESVNQLKSQLDLYEKKSNDWMIERESLIQSLNHANNHIQEMSITQTVNQARSLKEIHQYQSIIASLERQQYEERQETERVVRTINQAINQSINQSVNHSVNHSISQSITQSVSKSASQSVNQSISHSFNQSIHGSISPSVCQSVRQSVSQ
jgi:membrane-associated HD superfamily phosphohydrolase